MTINDEKHEELTERYKRRNLKEELGCMAYYQPDRPSKADREFQAWLCMAALKRINELEGASSNECEKYNGF